MRIYGAVFRVLLILYIHEFTESEIFNQFSIGETFVKLKFNTNFPKITEVFRQIMCESHISSL